MLHLRSAPDAAAAPGAPGAPGADGAPGGGPPAGPPNTSSNRRLQQTQAQVEEVSCSRPDASVEKYLDSLYMYSAYTRDSQARQMRCCCLYVLEKSVLMLSY